MPKILPLFLLLSTALLLNLLSFSSVSAQGRPPPAKSGRPTQHGGVKTNGDQDDGTANGDDDGEGGGAESDAGSGEREEPGLSKKLLNVLINHLSNHLPKVSTDSVIKWVQETFGLDEQSSRQYVKKAQEIKRRRGEE